MTDFSARMEALRTRFRARAGEDAIRMHAALSSGDRAELLRATHALAGNAGLFGFTALGEQAALVEKAIEAGETADRIATLTQAVISALEAIQCDP